MLMLYNSDSFAVVQIDVEADAVRTAAAPAAPNSTASAGSPGTPGSVGMLSHGGYEIVDKFLRKEIFIQGALAESFKLGVEALILTRPSEEEIDDYIERYSSLMQQPVVLH